MPARRPKTQISKIKQDRLRRRAGRKVKLWSKRSPGITVRGSTGGGFVVRESGSRKSARAGGAARHVVRGRVGGGAQDPESRGEPRGGIFALGDPTLARRVEEELHIGER